MHLREVWYKLGKIVVISVDYKRCPFRSSWGVQKLSTFRAQKRPHTHAQKDVLPCGSIAFNAECLMADSQTLTTLGKSLWCGQWRVHERIGSVPCQRGSLRAIGGRHSTDVLMGKINEVILKHLLCQRTIFWILLCKAYFFKVGHHSQSLFC